MLQVIGFLRTKLGKQLITSLGLILAISGVYYYGYSRGVAVEKERLYKQYIEALSDVEKDRDAANKQLIELNDRIEKERRRLNAKVIEASRVKIVDSCDAAPDIARLLDSVVLEANKVRDN